MLHGDHGCGKIDVHAHFLPDFYVSALHEAGMMTLDGGFPIPAWSEEAHLSAMERFGITASILSLTSPCVNFLSGPAAVSLARRVNEFAADLVLRRGSKFAAFAALPLPDVPGSTEVLRAALDDLDLEGVLIQTNSKGVYLGSDELHPVYAELDSRGAVILVHPTTPTCYEQVALGRPAPMIEFQFDTTRAIVDLIFTGTLAKFPNLKVIAPHGGAALSILAPRLAMFAEMPILYRPPGRDALLRDLKRLTYDLAASAHPALFSALRELVPATQIVFGSDWPFTPEPGVVRNVDGFEALTGGDPEREAMVFRNALNLFPKLARRLFSD